MVKGIVYILTNPCLDGWVKIGMTNRNDIEKRLEQLNSPTNIPLMFRAYALYYVDNPAEVEKDIHELIDMIDDSLHARETLSSGRTREREFFRISPERAFYIFKKVAKFRGDMENLVLVPATDEQQEEEVVASTRLKSFKFSMVDVPVGSELSFLKDDSITCTVVDNRNHVEYQGEVTTMSALAARLLDARSVAGPRFFAYKGEVLSDRRARMDAERAEMEAE